MVKWPQKIEQWACFDADKAIVGCQAFSYAFNQDDSTILNVYGFRVASNLLDQIPSDAEQPLAWLIGKSEVVQFHLTQTWNEKVWGP